MGGIFFFLRPGHVQCLRVLHKWHGDLTLGDGVLGFSPLQAAVLHGHLPAVMFLSGGECGVACQDAAPAGAEDARKSEEAQRKSEEARKSDHPPHARPQSLDEDSLIKAACAVSTDARANGSHGCNGCDASSASCVSTGRSLSRASALRRLCARDGNWNEDEGEDACCAGTQFTCFTSAKVQILTPELGWSAAQATPFLFFYRVGLAVRLHAPASLETA